MARKRRSGGLFAAAIRSLVVMLLAVGVGGALVMGVAGYFIAAHGSVLRGVLGATIAAFIMLLAGVIIAWQAALREAILTLLSAASLGHRTWDRLLQLTGLQNEMDARQPLAELDVILRAAGPQLASGSPAPAKGGWVGRRLAAGAQAAVAWLVIRVSRQAAAHEASEDRMVTIHTLKTSLAQVMDDRVGDAVRSRTRRLNLLIGGAGVVAASLAAWAIGQLPIGGPDPVIPPAPASSAESDRSSFARLAAGASRSTRAR